MAVPLADIGGPDHTGPVGRRWAVTAAEGLVIEASGVNQLN